MTSKNRKEDETRQAVRKEYGDIAARDDLGCCCSPVCCGDAPITAGDKLKSGDYPCNQISTKLGYSKSELESVPDGANMGLGCGNPQAIANLKPGETVVDLGAGGGFDCFLAAKQVGEKGRVIGVDMTPEMISKARVNAEKSEYKNVEFRLGEIEHLPIGDKTADVIISNCVINLSPDKPGVYRDAYRVLKPGGRIAVSDVVKLGKFPDEIKNNIAMLTACVTGASSIAEVEKLLSDAGFEQIQIRIKEGASEFIQDWAPGTKLEDFITSANIEAVKPG